MSATASDVSGNEAGVTDFLEGLVDLGFFLGGDDDDTDDVTASGTC